VNIAVRIIVVIHREVDKSALWNLKGAMSPEAVSGPPILQHACR
jgi:hypothetical protein